MAGPMSRSPAMEPAATSQPQPPSARKEHPTQLELNTPSDLGARAQNNNDVNMLDLGSLKDVPSINDLPDPTNNPASEHDRWDPSDPHIWNVMLARNDRQNNTSSPRAQEEVSKWLADTTFHDVGFQINYVDFQAHPTPAPTVNPHDYRATHGSFEPRWTFSRTPHTPLHILAPPVRSRGAAGYTALPSGFGATHLARESGGRPYAGPGKVDEDMKGDMQFWQRRHFEKWGFSGP